MLHVTNGDSAAEKLRAAELEGDVLPWRDVLHVGPVRAGLDAAALRAERARFLAAHVHADEAELLAAMEARDDRLDEAVCTAERIVLWFESDLYDVLQLAQIAERIPDGDAELVLVGVDRFRGVADLSRTEFRAARPAPFDAKPYRALWRAFTAPDPAALATLDGPPVVRDAAHRLLQELPWTTDGLGRSERQLREALANGATTREAAFVAAQRQEERPFLGDATAFALLEARDRAEDRWLGGIHLPAGAPPPWRYDPGTATVVAG
jgi:hypothetical protein